MYEPIDLAKYDVSAERGFLPKLDPLLQLSRPFSYWDGLACEMPSLLAARQFGRYAEKIPLLDTHHLLDTGLKRAHLLLAFFAHAYVWENWQNDEVRMRIPANIAVPLVAVAKRLGIPPTLLYDLYAINNWRRLDPNGPIEIGNIVLLQHFLGGQDEEWFILPHVVIVMCTPFSGHF